MNDPDVRMLLYISIDILKPNVLKYFGPYHLMQKSLSEYSVCPRNNIDSQKLEYFLDYNLRI